MSTAERHFFRELNLKLAPLRINYVIVWHALCGLLCIFFALTLLSPDTFQGISSPSDSAINTLDTFAESSIFRYMPSRSYVDVALFGILLGFGGLMLAQIPGLLQRKASARLIALGLNWVGTLLAGAYMIRQTTVNRDLLIRMIDNQPIKSGIFYDILDALPGFLSSFLIDGYTLDRIGQGAAVFPFLLPFALAAWSLFNRHVAEEYHETNAQREAIYAYLYISPYLLMASIFTIGLLILAFYLSFNDLDLFSDAKWIGFDNYREAFEDDRFLISLSNVVWYALIVTTLQTMFALILAVLMNDNFVGRRVFRTLFYAPSVTSPVVISLIFLWLFGGVGFVNDLLFNKVNMRPLANSLDIRIRDESVGPEWYQVANRLGDMIYLRPFFNGSWIPLFILVLVGLAVLVAARMYTWQITKSLELPAIQFTVGVAVVLSIVLTLVAEVVGGFDDLKAVVHALPMWSVVGYIVAVIFMNRRQLSRHVDYAVHNAVIAGGVWFLVVIVLSYVVGGMKGSVSAGTVAIGWGALGLLLGMVFAQSSYQGKRSVFLPEGYGSDENIPMPLQYVAKFGGMTLPVLLTLFMAIMVYMAGETAAYDNVRQMPDARFGALVARGPSVAFMTIMVQNIFTTAPTFMLMYLAALQDIPSQLYEAAQIDGASRLERFWKITVPMLRPVTLLIVVLGTIGTFQLFDQVAILTQGEPANTTMVPVYLIYTTALGDNRLARVGYASALAFILGAIIFVFTFVQRRYLERGTEQF